MCGTADDYRLWALTVAGVTWVFVFENYLGGGTVGVSFVMDNAPSIIPNATKVSEVKQVIEARRPLMVDVSVFAPKEVVVVFWLKLFPDLPEIQQAVRNELADLFRRESEPCKLLLLSHFNEAISIAAGEVDHELVEPNKNILLANNQIATLGTITWQW